MLKASFHSDTSLFYDLLFSEEYQRLLTRPELLRHEVLAAPQKITHFIIDEIQRIPALLNEVHWLIENTRGKFFGMSGSSARKLKRGQANLLAGRAWTYELFPLTHKELGSQFSLEKALSLGTLPSVYLCDKREESVLTLQAYSDTYLKEEIQAEALVRNLRGFLQFLRLAADENGHLLNYSSLAREVGTTYQTIKDYFQVLEDTLLGFFLFPYAESNRTRLVKHPKFYFFDTGIQRMFAKKTPFPLEPKTAEFGHAFEHFMIAEVRRLAAYQRQDYRFSFFHSAGHAEVDLVVETPQRKVFAIEMKATERPDSSLKGLKIFQQIRPDAIGLCACLAPHRRQLKDIAIVPWQDLFEILEL